MVLEPIARAFVAKKIRFKEGVARKLKSLLIIDLRSYFTAIWPCSPILHLIGFCFPVTPDNPLCRHFVGAQGWMLLVPPVFSDRLVVPPSE
jgi:hypothetical protein